MANMQKYSAGSTGGLIRHYERRQDEYGNYQQFGNQEIDITKTHLNYNLGPEREISSMDFIKQRCSEVDFVNRKNINVMVSWIITAPEGLATGIEHRENQRPLLKFEGKEAEGNLKLFFEESYKFLNQRYQSYGSDENLKDINVISSYVHMDETTPHMHYAFVPVVFDEQRGREKVSAKELINRKDLQTFHKDLEKHMERVFGREIGILNEATKGGNKSIDELKRGTAQKKLQAEISDLQKSRQSTLILARKTEDDVRYLRGQRKGLYETLEGLKGQIKMNKDKLSEIENFVEGKIKTKKGIEKIQERAKTSTFSGSVKLPKEDFDNLIKTTLASPRVEAAEKMKSTEDENERLKHRISDLESEKTRMGRLLSKKEHEINEKDKKIKELEPNFIRNTLEKAKVEADAKNKIAKAQKEVDVIMGRLNKVIDKLAPPIKDEFINHWENELQNELKIPQRSRGISR